MQLQNLSDECSKAVAPIRELMKAHKDGLALTQEEADKLSGALVAAHNNSASSTLCSDEEWERFSSLELRGWLAPGR
jgi:hypothetical protein